ncbi:MAG: DUF4411 family protein [Bacillota bacterium]
MTWARSLDLPVVAVLDTSAVVELKTLPPAVQMRLYGDLSTLRARGCVTYPKKVTDELSLWAARDAPYSWARSHRVSDPSFEDVRRVMAVVGDVVDTQKDHEDADPYVLALAVALQREHGANGVVVVSEDVRDRPTRISIATACRRLGLRHLRLREFLAEFGLYP